MSHNITVLKMIRFERLENYSSETSDELPMADQNEKNSRIISKPTQLPPIELLYSIAYGLKPKISYRQSIFRCDFFGQYVV